MISRSAAVISPEHLAMLGAGAIPEAHAMARPYETVTDPSRLAQLKIVRAARGCVPGLLIPMLDIRGATWGYQYRPDNPRLLDGKPVKYETPWAAQRYRHSTRIGHPGRARRPHRAVVDYRRYEESRLRRPVPAVHRRAVRGVELPRHQRHGRQDRAGRLERHHTQGREVVIAYDGDAARNPKVAKAVCALADFLKHRGATVKYLHLPDTDVKTGLDDYLVAGHDKKDLWRLVKPHQPPLPPQQPAPAPPAPAPAPPPPLGTIDGAALLDDVDAFLGEFVVYPSEHMRLAHTLWIAHTHLMDCWESTPRIAFLSPEPGSGKTRALEVTEPLVPRPVHAVNTTPAYLFRKVSDEAGPPTILYDEIDTVFGPKAKDNEEIRGMLNAGHRKGAVAGRCVIKGDKIVETEELPAYCAVALAGLDDLPDTIMTRSVVVRMRRAHRTEKVEPWRLRTDCRRPSKLGDRLADWADSVRATSRRPGPTCPTASRTATPTSGRRCWRSPTSPAGTGQQTARVAAVAAVADSKRKAPDDGCTTTRRHPARVRPQAADRA